MRFLARQGLAMRGDGAGEPDSNFLQLVQLRSEDGEDGKLADWMKRKSSKYTSHEIQNEMLQVMALRVLRQITLNLQSTLTLTLTNLISPVLCKGFGRVPLS